MPTGNVSIRLSIQDQETVRAALEKLGNDGQAALRKLEAAGSKPGAGLAAVDKTVADLKSRVEGSASSLGALGTFLTGLGPIGLVAAAGIGAAVAVIYEMSKAAAALGDRAQQFRAFSEATGLATTSIQALTAEGAKLGLADEQIGVGLQRFAVNLDAARNGTGGLYTELHRISPELAHQVASARDVATAYDLIGRAIASAHDKAQASGIAQAAFGRQGGLQGVLAAEVYRSGGIGSIGSQYEQAGRALDVGLIDRLAKLRAEIKEVEQENKDLASSWFAEGVLEKTLAADRAMQNMLLHAQELRKVSQDESWGDWFVNFFAKLGPAMAGEGGDFANVSDQVDAERLRKWRDTQGRQRGLEQLRAAYGAGGAGAPGAVNKYVDDEFSQLAGPHGKQGDFNKTVAGADEALRKLEAHLKALGSAATPTEKLTLEIAKLSVALQKGDIHRDEYSRSLAAFKDAQTEAATAARERLGIASKEEIYLSGLIKLQQDRADGFIKSDAEMAAAEQRLAADTERNYKAEQIKNSSFHGLAQMGQGDTLTDSLDKAGTSALNDFGKTIDDVLTTRPTRASDAWRKLALSVTQSIEQMIIKMLVLKPLATGLEGMFGNVTGLFGGATAGGATTTFAEGGIMTARGRLPLRRYASGGVATSPQLAMFGEGSTNEAYVPLPDGNAIPVKMTGGGGHTIVSSVNINYHAPVGVSGEESRKQATDFARQMRDSVSRAVDERIITHLRTGGLLNPA